MTEQILPSGRIIGGNYSPRGEWEIYVDYNSDGEADVKVSNLIGEGMDVSIIGGFTDSNGIVIKEIKDEDSGLIVNLFDRDYSKSIIDYDLFYDNDGDNEADVVIRHAMKDFSNGVTIFSGIVSDLNDDGILLFHPDTTEYMDLNYGLLHLLPEGMFTEMEKTEDNPRNPITIPSLES